MDILGPFASAGLFVNRELAEEAWDVLAEAGIPATVVTDPGLLGRYSVSVQVERADLDRAVATLQEKLGQDAQED
jgi:aspartokinase